MGTVSSSLVNTLRQYPILEPHQLRELTQKLQARFADPRALARELLRRGWLTPYQANQLAKDRGRDLVLGSYVLLDRIGEGGMGQVFKARNWKLGQVVALKMLRPERVSRPEAVRRFRREIQLASQLNHPNIVRALDADEIEGSHLLVMEYADGTDLARRVKESGPLTVRNACEYIRQAALGLQHAHAQGMVHRDIKPSNLLLTAPGAVVKILDLGMARLGEVPGGEAVTTMTQAGCVIGTADFMAPEQARDSHTADVRADLYSLGCSLYYVLTAQVPFPGGTATEKLMQHLLEEPRPAEQLRPEIGAEVAQVVRKLMAKRPEDRYQSAAEVAAKLASLVKDQRSPASITTKIPVPTTLRGMPIAKASVPPAPSGGRRRRIAVGVCLLVSGMVVSWAVLGRPGSPPTNRLLAQGKETVIRPAGAATGKPPEDKIDVKAPPATSGETQAQSTGAIYALALSTDGQLLASGGADDTIHLWDTETWRERCAPLRGHTGDIRALALAADGRTLASGAADQTVKLWAVPTGNELVTLTGHTGTIRSVVFAADGRTLASSADQDVTVRLWDVPGKRERSQWKGNDGGVHSLAFAFDSQTLACGGPDRLIRLLDIASNTERSVLKAHTSDVISLAYAPDGKRLASGTRGGVVRVWNPETKDNRKLKGPRGSIAALVFSPDGRRLAWADSKNRVVLLDVDTETALQEWPFSSPVHSVAFGPKGQYLIVGTGGGTLHVVRPDPSAAKSGK